jgi:hypothetical protein
MRIWVSVFSTKQPKTLRLLLRMHNKGLSWSERLLGWPRSSHR